MTAAIYVQVMVVSIAVAKRGAFCVLMVMVLRREVIVQVYTETSTAVRPAQYHEAGKSEH
jgi:hypothetical protein